MDQAQGVRLLEEWMIDLVRRGEQHDSFGVRRDPCKRRRRGRERCEPDEKHGVDAFQTRIERVGIRKITLHDFNIPWHACATGVAGQGAESALSGPQLGENFAADLTGRAGDENAFHPA